MIKTDFSEIHWGDGTVTVVPPEAEVTDLSHKYAKPGNYQIEVHGPAMKEFAGFDKAYTATLAQKVFEILGEKGFASFDTWGDAVRKEIYIELRELYDAGYNTITHGEHIMVLTLHPSNGICTMGGTPDVMTARLMRSAPV